MTARDVLAEIEQRENAATPGPWVADVNAVRPSSPAWECLALTYPTGSTPEPHHRDNAQFIAHARADVPRLVAALRAVLDLHRPVTAGDRPVCDSCLDSFEDLVDYPCPTIRAITDALSGVTTRTDR